MRSDSDLEEIDSVVEGGVYHEREGRHDSESVDMMSEDEFDEFGGNVRSEGDRGELTWDSDLGDIGHPDIDSNSDDSTNNNHNGSSDETSDEEESTTDGDGDSEREVRKRGPPKQFTYDKIGTPSIR